MYPGARFDWMEITFEDPRDPRIGDITQGGQAGLLALRLGARLVRASGRNGYAVAWNVVRSEDVLATVYGHSARSGEIHAVTTGLSCDEVVPVFRDLWPDHRVSRADSSVDFEADFEVIDRKAEAFALRQGIGSESYRNSEGGATRYLGSRKSENFGRVYKKSEQLRALHPELADTIPAGVVRFELEVKPGKRVVKELLSKMTADQLWGMGEWSQLFAVEFLGIEAPRVSTHFRRPSDWVRATHYLGEQYAPSVARRILEVGRDQARAEVLAALGLS